MIHLSHPSITDISISHANQVIGQLLHRVRRNAGLYGLGMVGNKHSLLRPDDNDADFSL